MAKDRQVGEAIAAALWMGPEPADRWRNHRPSKQNTRTIAVRVQEATSDREIR